MPSITTPTRRALLRAALLAPAVATLPSAFAAEPAGFPSKPIRVLVGFPPGGSTDAVFRVMARAAEGILGQPIVVDNRPGAGGTISILQTRNAPPDGYTLGLATMAVYRAPVTEDVGYDPIADLTYVVCLTHVPFAIVVRADSPFKTWADLVAFGRANPERMNYGVPAGLGNSGHLLMEEMTAQEKVKWNPIPYKGSADVSVALLAGDVQFVVDGSGGYGSLVDSGKARLLAVASDERSPKWTTVPTTRELGYRASIDSPWGLVGPKNMSPAVVRTLQEAFRRSLEAPDVKAAMLRYGQGPRFKDTAEFTRFAVKATVDERALLTKYGFAKR
ncbi:tripartite tricarboxylate transporter substrate binding protein [Variovorax sp. UC122_21]|uniref:tripartite tricarboxylate transporter substrate binding protein n=1 Tax=Variovorax TaxID=34072 RepID=UPI0019348983|nr:tripartite tricarboxylate transporter substrate binding protein [Variovorax paradoxus]